jgi:hypothetical protein
VFLQRHRGNVRLQIKLNDFPKDCKAQFLSYICWLFDIGGQSYDELGKFVESQSSCPYGRKCANAFGNEEFCCLNPLHYCTAPSGEGEHVQTDPLQVRRVQASLSLSLSLLFVRV